MSSTTAKRDRLQQANQELVLAALREQGIADELRAQACLRDLLLGIVGHDLRTPLAAIRVIIESVIRSGRLNPEATKLMCGARDTALRMGSMIAELLDFTRALHSGQFWIEPKPGNLRRICETVVREIEGSHRRKGAFVCRFEGNLDGLWDADRIAQVVSNLGENALRYGARTGRVLLRARDLGDEVRLAVTNRGKPIPPQAIPSLFDPFRRVRQKKTDGDGLGFGLYIAQEIVRAHGGTMAVRSTASEGTTFSVVLPRRPPASLRRAADDAPRRRLTASSR